MDSDFMAELLEPIIEYQMSDLEAKAYKVGLLWLGLTRKHFPEYKHSGGYPKKGDPRKSSLFKWCYKLVRETQGLIPDNEYVLYIKAQLDVLKAIDMGAGRHPRIEPQCLAGDKAWVRWKLWKRKYDMIAKRSTKEDVGLDVTPFDMIVRDLRSTKAFLSGRFGGDPKEEQIMMAARDMERWVALGKVSPIYALLSPWVRRHCPHLVVDLDLYKPSITAEVTNYFAELFPNET
jgi:hypothetical protein